MLAFSKSKARSSSFVSMVSSQQNRQTVKIIAVYRSSQFALGHQRHEKEAKSLFLNFLDFLGTGNILWEVVSLDLIIDVVWWGVL